MCCCTLHRAILSLAILAAIGVSLWWFVPWNDLADQALENAGLGGENVTMEDISSKLGDLLGSDLLFSDDDENGDATSYTPDFQFIQCGDDEDGTSTAISEMALTTGTTGQCCNGLPSNCNLRVNDILFATLHNAMSTKDDKFYGPNHVLSMEKALKAGYRAFMLDVCDCSSDDEKSSSGPDLYFCHGLCLAGQSSISTKLQNAVEFLNENPSEVIVLEFEFPEGSGMEYVNGLYSIMESDVNGFTDLMYVHDDTDTEWPLMSELVDGSINKRIIVFHHNGPSSNDNTYPSGMHSFNQHVAQNKFSYETRDAVLAYDNSCSVEIGNTNQQPFFLVNHFITQTIGQKDEAREINVREYVTDHINTCAASNENVQVNFLVIDFWSLSELPTITQEYNLARAGGNTRLLRSS